MKSIDLIELKEKILKNEITTEDAIKVLRNIKGRSWELKEWKEKRNEIIKDSCEQCGSNEVLTIQHTWHPRNYFTAKSDIYNKYYSIVEESFSDRLVISENEVLNNLKEVQKEREVCPKCDSINVTKRKTVTPPYKCNKCKGTFEEGSINYKLLPEFIDDRINPVENRVWLINIITYTEIQSELYGNRCNELVKENYTDQIEKETALTIIEDSIRYISLEDTKTFCKKCAFLWDKRDSDLCPVCKVKYKNILSSQCYDCSKKNKDINSEVNIFR